MLHFHARHLDGRPDHATESYTETVSAIRQSSDILVHPTLGDVTVDVGPEERLSHILEMAKDPATGPHMAPADMGSFNIDIYNPQARRFDTNERLYKNSTLTLTYLCENMKRAGVKPYLSCWNIGFIRCAAAFMDMGIIEVPAYVGFILTYNSLSGRASRDPQRSSGPSRLPAA